MKVSVPRVLCAGAFVRLLARLWHACILACSTADSSMHASLSVRLLSQPHLAWLAPRSEAIMALRQKVIVFMSGGAPRLYSGRYLSGPGGDR